MAKSPKTPKTPKPPKQPRNMPTWNHPYDTPLFHGTSRDIEGAVLPNAVHKQGRMNSRTESGGDPSREDRLEYDEWLRENKAYATADEGYAWKWFAHRTADLGGGRGRVYEVHPQPDMAPGAFGNETTAARFPIKQRIDIKPGHQGTFPIDWRPYLAEHLRQPVWGVHGVQRYSPDQVANHPEPKTGGAWDRDETPDRREEVPGQMPFDLGITPPLSHQFGGLVPGGGV